MGTQIFCCIRIKCNFGRFLETTKILSYKIFKFNLSQIENSNSISKLGVKIKKMHFLMRIL